MLTYKFEDPHPDDTLYGNEDEEEFRGRYRYEGTIVYRNGKFITIQSCEHLIEETSDE